MVEVVSSTGSLNSVKNQQNINCLRIIGNAEELDDCLSLIAENKPDTLWPMALDIADQYQTEDGSFVVQLHLDSLLEITFGEVRNLSRLFCGLLFIADGQDMVGGLPRMLW